VFLLFTLETLWIRALQLCQICFSGQNGSQIHLLIFFRNCKNVHLIDLQLDFHLQCFGQDFENEAGELKLWAQQLLSLASIDDRELMINALIFIICFQDVQIIFQCCLLFMYWAEPFNYAVVQSHAAEFKFQIDASGHENALRSCCLLLSKEWSLFQVAQTGHQHLVQLVSFQCYKLNSVFLWQRCCNISRRQRSFFKVGVHSEVEFERIVPIILETKAVIDQQEVISSISIIIPSLRVFLHGFPLFINPNYICFFYHFKVLTSLFFCFIGRDTKLIIE